MASKKRKRLPKVTLVTDGAYKQKKRLGGWSALLQCGNGFKVHYGNAINTTNNRMELQAVVEGLKDLTTPCRVQVVSDSMYVINGIKNWASTWKSNDWRTKGKKPVANRDLWNELLALKDTHKVSTKWVRGHNGHRENELVDDFASSSCHMEV